MKNRKRNGAAVGLLFGIVMGISYKSIPGGLFIAGGAALLLFTLTSLETDPKTRN